MPNFSHITCLIGKNISLNMHKALNKLPFSFHGSLSSDEIHIKHDNKWNPSLNIVILTFYSSLKYQK